MHVGIITYETGHLKTFQLIQKFLVKSFKITLFAFPFKLWPRKFECFEDRPYQIIELDIEGFCQRYNIRYIKVDGWGEELADRLGDPKSLEAPDVYLTCIAKIIPKHFIENRIILNCHPGLLPKNRGVDAFKWSIVNSWPIGCTLHLIDEFIDRGTILHRMKIPILPNDNLRDVCMRAYDMEIDLMANFERYLENRNENWQVGDSFPVSHKKIPKDVDKRIDEIYYEKREVFIHLSL
jgi:phosphoribosylglycinamide formyltransferase-1